MLNCLGRLCLSPFIEMKTGDLREGFLLSIVLVCGWWEAAVASDVS